MRRFCSPAEQVIHEHRRSEIAHGGDDVVCEPQPKDDSCARMLAAVAAVSPRLLRQACRQQGRMSPSVWLPTKRRRQSSPWNAAMLLQSEIQVAAVEVPKPIPRCPVPARA
jgi:hypothetical protein